MDGNNLPHCETAALPTELRWRLVQIAAVFCHICDSLQVNQNSTVGAAKLKVRPPVRGWRAHDRILRLAREGQAIVTGRMSIEALFPELAEPAAGTDAP